MRAWLLHDASGPARAIGSTRSATPEPAAGEVRVRLHASALNHLDLWVARGMPAPPSFPHITGADGAGVVDAVGPQVDDVGDRRRGHDRPVDVVRRMPRVPAR